MHPSCLEDMTQVLYLSRKLMTCTLRTCSEKCKKYNFLLIKFSNLWKKAAKNPYTLQLMHPNCMRGTINHNAFSESFWLVLSRPAQIFHENELFWFEIFVSFKGILQFSQKWQGLSLIIAIFSVIWPFFIIWPI